VTAFHHVNLGVPPGGVESEGQFLVDVLGYRRMPVPDELQAFPVNWFEAADGSQVHLSEDPDHQAAVRAHVAVVVGDELDGVVAKLQADGTDIRIREGLGLGRVAMCRDPAGNLWELRSG
jgi:catechol 2,3-dioxygenase-like lactoylglutathione lyase family enzyme